MKKVEKVSIGGYAFTLDEDAYLAAKEYLDALQNRYSSSEEGSEVMEGLEERFAELLLDRCREGDVVTQDMVDTVKGIIGNPSDIDGDEKFMELNPEKKKLFRDAEHKVFCGVCSGLANYFGVDVVLVRIIWIVLLILSFVISDHTSFDSMPMFVVLLYLAFCISMPVPKTTSEIKYARKSSSASSSVDRSAFWTICGTALRLIFGGILLLCGASAFAVGLVILFNWQVLDMQSWFSIGSFGILFEFPRVILLALVCLLPCLTAIYEGVKIIFNLNSPKYHPGLIAALVWVISVIALSASSALAFLPIFNIN